MKYFQITTIELQQAFSIYVNRGIKPLLKCLCVQTSGTPKATNQVLNCT